MYHRLTRTATIMNVTTASLICSIVPSLWQVVQGAEAPTNAHLSEMTTDATTTSNKPAIPQKAPTDTSSAPKVHLQSFLS